MNDTHHDKLNSARRKQHRQELSAYDEVENAVIDSLKHNEVFENAEIIDGGEGTNKA